MAENRFQDDSSYLYSSIEENIDEEESKDEEQLDLDDDLDN
jgi:hypothetical protein